MRPSGNRLESVRGSRAIYAFSNRDMWSQALIGAGYIIGAVALIGESVRRGVVAIGLLLSRAVLSLSRPWTRRVCTLRPYAAAGSFLAPSATPDFAARRRIPDLLLRDISQPPHTAAFGVEPPRSGARTRRSETGASRPLAAHSGGRLLFGSQPAFSLSAGTALHAPTPAVRNTPSGPARLSGERSFATTHLWSHSLRCVPSFPDPGWVCCGEQRKPNSIRRLMSSAVQRWVRSSAVDCSAPAKEPSGFSVRVTM